MNLNVPRASFRSIRGYTIAAALLGLSLNAFAAVSDISNVTHGQQAGQELKVGQITEPRFSDRNAQDPRSEAKPLSCVSSLAPFWAHSMCFDALPWQPSQPTSISAQRVS